MATNEPVVTYEKRGQVAYITLNRPRALNAISSELVQRLTGVLREFRDEDEMLVAIVTGEGGRAFSAGADLKEINQAQSTGPGRTLPIVPFRNINLWKPVIGAINGMACGGAFYLLAECDILIAAEHATFFDPHVTYGMAAVYEPMKMLTKMPFGEVMRMSLTGNAERITAGTALRMGLVSEVVPGDELEAAATRLSDSIAANPPWAVQGTLRAIWAAQDLGRLASRDVAAAIYAAAMDPGALADGSETFTSGARPEPRLR